MQKHDETILSPEAIAFLARLHKKFNPKRLALLEQRKKRQKEIEQGRLPHFLPETEAIRSDSLWKVGSIPRDLEKRWIEITGPTDRKMIINALNSGADLFMADFEDANSPTWENMIQGQLNLKLAAEGVLSFQSPEGKHYSLNSPAAVLAARPRGWHLDEKHFLVGDQQISGSLFDFGLFFFHNAKTLLRKGSGPYLYLPKIESHLEARLWNDIFLFSQKELDIPRGTIKATVLIETLPAAFEMEEILYELREHIVALNAGRWDYIFSIIKTFQKDPKLHFPDRSQVTMKTPFMTAYAERLVYTCHKRGAHAIGGMSALIPDRKDPEATKRALNGVRDDKVRELAQGFDGTWIAHPDLVPIVKEVFEEHLGHYPHQKQRREKHFDEDPRPLLDFHIRGGKISESGLRTNINVGIQYLASWLAGKGAAAIHNLMEDTATAEISRAQIWLWLQRKECLENGLQITRELIEKYIAEESEKIASKEAAEIFKGLVLYKEFAPFLTLEAYPYLR